MEKPDPKQILRSAKKILLIDWPDKSLPKDLLDAGFEVFTYSPDHYSQATIEDDAVVFNGIECSPVLIDIVNVFRPGAEHEGIIQKRVLPLGAKVVWLHPPIISSMVDELVSKYNITIVQGEDIAGVAGTL